MAKKSVTLTQIKLEQDHAEDEVRAQSALIGERKVAWVRLAMLLMIGASTAILSRLTDRPIPPSTARMVLVAVYFFFTVSTLYITHTLKKAEPKKAMWIPLSYIAVDAGFFLGQGWIAKTLGEPPHPEIVVAMFALLLCFSVARVRTVHVVASTAVSITSVVVVAILEGWAHPVWTTFVCSCLLALGLLITFTNLQLRTMIADIRQRDNLARFLPRQVVARVLASGGSTLHPVQREVTVLFSDIRSFTSMSEHMLPRDVLEFLDEYFGHMGQIVRGHEGMLNKFIGDGLMAVWGVPDNQADHAERALKAAVDMRRKMVEINQGRVNGGLPTFKIGIGLHTGVVAAGMLGGSAQSEYTVIGDAVNLASRIESLTKEVGTDILASESTWNQGGRLFEGDRVGEEHVKGRAAGVVVYAVRERSAG